MEKIQAAIAKARAEREARTTPVAPPRAPANTDVPQTKAPEPAPQPAPAALARETAPADIAEAPAVAEDVREAAWRRIPTCTPRARIMARHRVVSFDTEKRLPPVDILRTRVLQQMRTNGWTRLAITSPGPGCGKSTLTLNLAFSIARASENRVIVGELDMRRPSLARTLSLKGSRSFARVLRGEADFEAEAVRPRPNLAIGVNEVRVRNPAELLQGPTIGPALERIQRDFAPDVMIFDLPPLLASDDAMAVMGQVDCVLLVVAAGTTTVKEVDFAEADLSAQTNVLGVVLNKCRYMESSAGYGYGDY